ncbi:hypothetical protein pb186bvf_020095 [Paramecium bursaria]
MCYRKIGYILDQIYKIQRQFINLTFKIPISCTFHSQFQYSLLSI